MSSSLYNRDKRHAIDKLNTGEMQRLAKKMGCREKCHSFANENKHYEGMPKGEDMEGEYLMTYYDKFSECLKKEWDSPVWHWEKPEV